MNKINTKIMYFTRLGYALSLIIVGLALRFSSASFVILGNVALGIAAVMLAFLVLKLMEKKTPKFSGIMNKLMTYAVILFCLAFATTEGAVIYGYETAEAPDKADSEENETDESQKADCVIVLGAAVVETEPSQLLLYRLTAAAEYLNRWPDATCIVSGGISTSKTMSEAQCMYNWLTANGISGDRIIMEDRAQDTYQNIKFSYEIIEERKMSKSVAVLTGDYHVLRAKLMAKVLGHEPVMVSAGTDNLPIKINYYVREVFAIWNRMIFGYQTA